MSRLTAPLFEDAEIARLLSAEADIAAMIRFEAALARAEAMAGVIPDAAGAAIADALERVAIAPEDLTNGTLSAGVPVPGLVKLLRRQIGAPHGDYLHWGATTQDVMDTSLVLRLSEILTVLEARLVALMRTLAQAAETHADLPMAGRTRSQIATPITLGLRIASWLAPLIRCFDRLQELRPRLLVLQLGGAAGTLSVLGGSGPLVSAEMARQLELSLPLKPWHTERDGIVELGGWLGLVSGLLGRIGADLILMGRSESGELRAGQGGGSSTMPQKANPLAAEALVALARHAAGQVGLMQSALCHVEERDATAWAVEWQALPPLLHATGAGLIHAQDLASTLSPDPAAMARILGLQGGAVEAEALAFALAAQMPLGQAQEIVKTAARTRPEGSTLSAHLAAQNPELQVPPAGEIRSALTTSGNHITSVVTAARTRIG
ncbi:MAG: lyase family protein [Pseudomonadota bacterium]